MMKLEAAIEAHDQWKVKFRHAISQKAMMNVDLISAVHCCALGAWLHGEVAESHGALRNYADVVGKHGEFHLQAGRIAAAINEGKYVEAEAMMAQGTAFSEASHQLTSALKSLWIEAGN